MPNEYQKGPFYYEADPLKEKGSTRERATVTPAPKKPDVPEEPDKTFWEVSDETSLSLPDREPSK